MHIVDVLEGRIREVLERDKFLRAENSRLADELSFMAREKSVLEEENRNLLESLAAQERLRIEALRRIDGLLRKIMEYEKDG